MSHIWKRRLLGTILASIFALSLSLVAAPARAAGETYTWNDLKYSSVSISGGSLQSPMTLNKSADAGDGGATFAGLGSYTCDSQTRSGSFTLIFDKTNWAGGKPIIPTAAKLTAPDSNCADFDTDVDVSATDNTQQGGATTDKSADDCSQGSFTWLFCPVIDNVSGAVTHLAKDVLVPMLEINRITPDSTPGLYHAWQNLLYFSEALLILVFFIIIFATMTQQDIGFFDQYTVKKTLPRLVIAAILLQFSFLLSGLIVDIGNVSGAGIQTLLTTVTDPSKGAPSLPNLVENLATGAVGVVAGAGTLAVLASWTAAIPILLSLLISLMVVFLTLGARFLIIAVLVVISPLAIVAWVLPNTEHLFHDWRKVFTRLVLMYPIVVGVLTLASVINEVLSFGGGNGTTTASAGAATAVMIIKPLVVIAAFLIIPASFKLAGRGLDRVHGLLSGAGQTGKGALKNSDMWQRGKEERQARKNAFMERALDSKAVTAMNKRGITKPVAGLMSAGASLALMRAPSNKEALERSDSALVATRKKQIESLREARNPYNLKDAIKAQTGNAEERKIARAKLETNAPNLLKYGTTPAGLLAMSQILKDTAFLDSSDTQSFLEAGPRSALSANANMRNTYQKLLSDTQDSRKVMPAVAMRVKQDNDAQPVKDGAGNVTMTMARKTGQIDVGGSADVFRKMRPNEFAEKMGIDNLDLLTMRDGHNGANRAQDAGDFALSMAMGVDSRMLADSMDASKRNSLSLKKRIKLVEGFHANADKFQKPEYRAKYDAALAHIGTDSELSYEVARMANVSDQQLAGYGDAARANIARDWMNGHTFDAYHDYNSGGKYNPPSSGGGQPNPGPSGGPQPGPTGGSPRGGGGGPRGGGSGGGGSTPPPPSTGPTGGSGGVYRGGGSASGAGANTNGGAYRGSNTSGPFGGSTPNSGPNTPPPPPRTYPQGNQPNPGGSARPGSQGTYGTPPSSSSSNAIPYRPPQGGTGNPPGGTPRPGI